MKTRTLVIVLGVALAVSVAINLFAATAAFTALNAQHRIERRVDGPDHSGRRPGPRELVAALRPEARGPVREALRAAGLRAHPDFKESRQARRDAVAAAAADPYDAARVGALLAQSRAAEERGRAKLEADALAILATLEPADRAAFAQILNSRSKGGGGRGEARAEKR
ncbi:MAG: periplasmic heavy metal sensor [Alphaproteobacteria bacterium]|nr:periplasmic heavy metal sensor [Alphaproteobacteria bacterium]MBU2379137.1 periplasmic heavy metal sensor [Alphaproteobacteria bacterium]